MRGLTRAMLGAGLSAVVACTAANPAYQVNALADAETFSSALPDAESAGHEDVAAPDAGSADAQSPDAPAVDAEPPAFGISGVDSLAVDADGTLYFDQNDSVHVWIGRRRPDGLPQLQWISIPAGLPTRGLAIDTARRALYLTAGTPMAVIQAIDVDGVNPAPRTIASGLTNPNDLAVGADGNIYVSEQNDGHIYSFTPTGVRVRVTKTPIGDPASGPTPAALAFGPDRALYVGVTNEPIVRLGLAGGVESSRSNYGTFADWTNGLAFDEKGRLYVAIWTQATTGKSVVRLDSATAPPFTVLTGRVYSAMVFGRGALDTRWLYVAEPGGPLHRIDTDTPGLPLP